MRQKLYCMICDETITDLPHALVELNIQQFNSSSEPSHGMHTGAHTCYPCLLAWLVETAIPIQKRLREEHHKWEARKKVVALETPELTPPAEDVGSESTASKNETRKPNGNS